MEHVGVRDPIPGVVYPKAADLQRYVGDGVLSAATLPTAFRDAVSRHGVNLALVSADEALTYTQLDESTDRLAAALLRTGLRPLDRVVFQLGNSVELVLGWLACLKAGLIPLCTLAAHREREIGYLAELAEARMHFVQGDDPKFDDVAFAQRMQAVVPSLKWVLQARGTPRGEALSLRGLMESVPLDAARSELSRIEIDPYQVAVFQLSGGTTGVPKIIPRFHNDYVCNMRSVAGWLGYRPDDVLFMPMPMVHNLNMGCCFGPFLLTGGTVTVAANLQPDALLEVIVRNRPTWLVLNAAIVAKLDSALASGKVDLSNVRGCITSNGAAKMRELLGVPVYTIFGMTEGVIMLTREGDPQGALDATVGRPVCAHDSVKILVPDSEDEVQPGEVGEPVFKGPYTLHGYYKAEERNKEAFTSDGYYRSGDLMAEQVIEGKSFYVFRGRLKDVISRGGEKINSQELEHAICGHPAVAAAAVVGVPDAVFGERACAVLVVRDGMTAPDVAQLGAFLQEYGLAKFKWPERVEVVAGFPLTLSGKLSKPALREMLATRV